MKKIILLVVMLISVTLVVAQEPDMSIDALFISGRDINGNLWFDAGRDVNLNIDGLNFPQTIDNIYQDTYEIASSSGKSSDEIYSFMSKIWMDNPHNEWEYVSFTELNYNQQKLRWVLDQSYVPKKTYDDDIRALNNTIINLYLRLEALESRYTAEENCIAKTQLVKKYNMTAVTCGNTTYYNHIPEGFLAITPVEVIENINLINTTFEKEKQMQKEEECIEKTRGKLSYLEQAEFDVMLRLYKANDQYGFETYLKYGMNQQSRSLTAFEVFMRCME